MEKYMQDWPVDAHFHGRHPLDARFALIGIAGEEYEYAVWMPNLAGRPVLKAEDVEWYRRSIEMTLEHQGILGHRPLVVVKATHETTPAALHAAFDAGAVAIKCYPVDATCDEGLTTNAHGGVHDFFAPEIRDLYKVCVERGKPVLLHGEVPDVSVSEPDREYAFDPILCRIVDENPDLPVVFEHISDRRMVRRVAALPDRVVATITPHHLLNIGADNVNPHNKCMPTAKHEEDRTALVVAALSGSPKFFFGSDNAPHLRQAKEEPGSGKGPANGVFNTPVAMSELIELFHLHRQLDRLNDFTSTFARRFYGLPPASKQVTYVREPHRVPDEIHGVVPLRAGYTTCWRRQ